MDWLYKLLMTFSSTLWMIVVYGFRNGWTIEKVLCKIFPQLRSVFSSFPLKVPIILSQWILAGVLIAIILLLSKLTIYLSKFAGGEEALECKDIILNDNVFLPSYLGYFFISLSVSDNKTMAFVYVLLFTFTYLSQTQYFNPAFLLMKYHFYDVTTKQSTRIFIICKGKIINNPSYAYFQDLKRINDTTFIERR